MFNFFKKKEPEIIEEVATAQYEDFNDVSPIAKYFHNETGITFDKQLSILKSKVTSFCKQRDVYSFSQLLENVKTQERLKQELIDYLTTNETFFYREFKQIEELVKLVKKSGSRVKILCAPCSTGEEPYSIVIALLEAGVSPSDVQIVGIDINARAIQKAKEAVYKERNLRNLSEKIVSNRFIKNGDGYVLKEEIKSRVSFATTNLFDPSFKELGKFDYVFSRNMLIYFDEETKLRAKSVLESMRKESSVDVFFGHADLF